MNDTVLAKVFRGETLESEHRGSVIVLRGDEKLFEAGDPNVVTFTRSAAKAFQAIPFVASGAIDAFGYSEKELAFACASHSSEPFHIETARAMLEKAGFAESDLGCGGHPPFHEESAEELIRSGREAGPVYNNCSGKHAAMLAYAKHIGADPATYLDRDNPVQREIVRMISLFSGENEDDIRMGTDGCSAPNFAIPLASMAKAYLRLIDPPANFDPMIKAAARRIVAAKIRHPEYVGGSYRLDTKVMKAMKGRVVCKVGAEGVWLAGVLPEKDEVPIALALKISDGNDHRARPAVAIEILRRLGLVSGEAEELLGEFSPMEIKNRRDVVVGRVEPVLPDSFR